MKKTLGISPKVKNPAILGVLIGVGLLIAGLIAKDSDIRTAGISVLLAALGLSGGVGYLSDPGEVATTPPVASDALLSDEAKKRLGDS